MTFPFSPDQLSSELETATIDLALFILFLFIIMIWYIDRSVVDRLKQQEKDQKKVVGDPE